MKANEAPEKIYFTSTENDTHYYTEGIPFEREYVEYVRKDAFIENAEKWLDEHILDYVYSKDWGQGVGVEGELFDDFIKYMKGE